MPFNINDFIQNTKTGFARDAFFEIQLNLPASVEGVDSRQLAFMCHSASLPGRKIENINVSRYGMGFTEPFAVGTSFDELTVEFYVDGNAENLKTLHRWMDSIFVFGGQNNQQLEYSDNYTVTISLFQYDVTGKKIAEWKFYQAYPEGLPPVSLSWAAKDRILSATAVFRYSRYEQIKITEPTTSVDGQTKPAQNNRLPETPTIKL